MKSPATPGLATAFRPDGVRLAPGAGRPAGVAMKSPAASLRPDDAQDWVVFRS